MPQDWLEDFHPFSVLHLLCVLVFGSAIGAACLFGRRLGYRSRPERRFRVALGIGAVSFALARLAYYLAPSRFEIGSNLPLHACDLGMLVAALALITARRPWRALLYFWGLGLSSQAFITPALVFGIGWPQFWLFWGAHTVVVGAALYDLVVGHYRPTARDLRLALAVTLVYGLSVFALDAATGWGYAFLGPSKPDNPSLIDLLGPWPLRVPIIFAMGGAVFTALWAIWPMMDRLRSRARPSPDPRDTRNP